MAVPPNHPGQNNITPDDYQSSSNPYNPSSRPDSQATRMINPSEYDYNTRARKDRKNTMIILVAGGVLLVAGLCALAYVLMSGKGEKDPGSEGPLLEQQPADAMPAEVAVPEEGQTAEPAVTHTADGPRVASKAGTPWREGHNVLVGSFSYEGSKYGFTVTLDYSSATGRVSNATYEAHGYGKASPVSTAVLSNDGSVLYLKGKASGQELKIDVTAPKGSGTFSGTYQHGSHSSGCTLTIQ